MIDVNELYKKTDGGLQILRYYYNFLDADYARTRKKFKLRDETDASASMRLVGEVYKITDFGQDGREKSPVDIAMEFEGLNFYETVRLLADRYNISEYGDSSRHSITRTEREATDSEPDGYFGFEEHEVTDKELGIMGMGVKKEHFRRMGWHALTSYTIVKERTAITRTAGEGYYIFARECNYIDQLGKKSVFYKLYQPLAKKEFRFCYYPAGRKQKGYINGLHELIKLYDSQDEEEEKQKLDAAYICSGERDALCVAARGGNPIWFNSETIDIQLEDILLLKKYVKTIYNIPDIDDTGVRQGKKLALKFLDVETIWLPASLKRTKDWRGNSMKDFRDWCELHPSSYDFNNLCRMGLTAQFWRIGAKNGKLNCDIDLECLHYFLRLNDFFIYHDEDADNYIYMRQQGQVIKRTSVREIKNFLRDWARERCVERIVRNTILSQRITDNIFESLDERKLNLKNYNKEKQLYFFKNCCVVIDDKDIIATTDTTSYTLEDSVIKHNLHIDEDYFEATKDSGEWTINIRKLTSKYFCYLINSSRIYWRKELEEQLEPWAESKREDYRIEHKFSITSEYLTEEENKEQILCLLSKMFAIGYYMHRYKTASRAWAAYCMDWKLGEKGENNGRSGKSFFFKFTDIFMNCVKLSGRNKKLMDNQHVYDQVDKFTDFVLIDDCNALITPDLFYDTITSDMNVNPKLRQSYTIPFDESPKFAFTTNFVPLRFDPSSVGRLIYLVFSDYYHVKTSENDYRENREIFNDFNKTLFTDYSEEELNADINFFLQCLRFYLQAVQIEKIQPVLDNIIKRSLKATMSDSFEDWARGYFATEGNNVNRLIEKVVAFNDCRMQTGQNNLTSQRFMKQLKSFIELNKETYKEINPPAMCGRSGRIIKTENGLTREYLYISTN